MEGSGKVSIHDSIVGPDLKRNLTQSKRCLWVRGTHDLETREHALSAVGSSRRWSTMMSRISGGRESNIVVSTKTAMRVIGAASHSHTLCKFLPVPPLSRPQPPKNILNSPLSIHVSLNTGLNCFEIREIRLHLEEAQFLSGVLLLTVLHLVPMEVLSSHKNYEVFHENAQYLQTFVGTTASCDLKRGSQPRPPFPDDRLGQHMADPPPVWRVYLPNFPPTGFHHLDMVSQGTLLPIEQGQHPIFSSDRLKSRN